MEKSGVSGAKKKTPTADAAGVFTSEADGNRTRNLRIDSPGL